MAERDEVSTYETRIAAVISAMLDRSKPQAQRAKDAARGFAAMMLLDLGKTIGDKRGSGLSSIKNFEEQESNWKKALEGDRPNSPNREPNWVSLKKLISVEGSKLHMSCSKQIVETVIQIANLLPSTASGTSLIKK